jgi:hypothetical protein
MLGVKSGGFDVVIGNPPYVRQERLGQEQKDFLKERFPVIANGSADLYVYFFGCGLELLKDNGILCFITLNKYLKTKYGLELRNMLAKNYTVDLIIDFFELPVFTSTTDSCITKIINTKNGIETKYYPVKTLENLDINKLTAGKGLKVIKDTTEWKFVNQSDESILEKIYSNTITLKEFVHDKIFSGIKTGFNEAFVLDDAAANQLLKSESKKLVKPYAKSTDITKWGVRSKKYFLATGYDLDIRKKYPTAYNYLKQFETNLKNRQDQGEHWWNLRACAYYADFSSVKLIYIHTAINHQFYYDTEGMYINNSCYMIVSDSKYLFCFLNSKLFEWFKKIKFVAYGDASERGRAKLDYNKMITVPIKKVTSEQEKSFAALFDRIRAIKAADAKADTSTLEAEIDRLVYGLYGLTEGEVAAIELPAVVEGER